MNETGFNENFVWYEWSFVSPEDLPPDHGEAQRKDDAARRERQERARRDAWEASRP